MKLEKENVNKLKDLLELHFPHWKGFSDKRYLEEEREYKVKTMEKTQKLLGEEELRGLIEKGKYEKVRDRLIEIGRDNNLLWTNIPPKGDLNILHQDDLDLPAFCEAFFDLIYGNGDSPQRLERYLEYVESEGLSSKWTFPTYFLFFCHPDKDMFVKPKAWTWAFETLSDAELGEVSGENYRSALDLANSLRQALNDLGPRDMIDVQSFIWVAYEFHKKVLKKAINQFLTKYKNASKEDFGGHEFHEIRARIEKGISELELISKRKDLLVKVSIGQGNWATVPWIGFFDSRETDSATHGIYVVYLFPADLSGVYLTIIQGYTKFKQGNTDSEAREKAEKKAKDLRTNFEGLEDFNLDNEIDLRSENNLAKGYEASTIANKYYQGDEIPPENDLEEDLQIALDSYVRYIESEKDTFLRFTEEDFERCSGNRDDAKYVWERLKQFKEALIPKLEARLQDFVWREGRQTSPYVAQWFKQKGGGGITPRDHLWLGMSHKTYENPRHGVQFQFGINQQGLFAMGLWIESGVAQGEKERAASLIGREPGQFLELLKPLFPDFKVCFQNADGDRTFFEPGEDVDSIIQGMEDSDSHFVVMRDLSKEKIIELGPDIVEETVDSFERLLPLHDFIVGQAGGVVDRFHAYVHSQGFNFSREVVANYYTALKTKPFVILTGISGTGKTKLAQLFAEFMAGPGEESDKRHAFISVRPDWTDSKGLLGFYNAIREKYEPTETLKLLIRACEEYWTRIELTPTRDGFRANDDGIDQYQVLDGVYARVEIDKEGRRTQNVVSKFTVQNGTIGIEDLEPNDTSSEDRVTAYVPNRNARPYFVILDEMNLAKVEYYFSDFLSTLESRRIIGDMLWQEPVDLHDQPREQVFTDTDGDKYSIPPRLEVPPNVYFTGTVNVDETTYMFSPKVLDRANTIEFNDVDLENYRTILEEHNQRASTGPSDLQYLASPKDVRSFTSEGRFVEKLISKDFDIEDLGRYYSELMELKKLLKPHNLHFGYRVVDEVLCYLENAKPVDVMGPELEAAFDLQILQKILPKLHGNRNQLEKPLAKLLRYSLDETIFTDEPVNEILPKDLEETIKIEGDFVTYESEEQGEETRPSKARYHKTCKKVLRMLKKLREQGFVSFIE